MDDSTFVLEHSSATSSLDILSPLTAQLDAAPPLWCIDLTALCHAPMSSKLASVERLRAALLRHVPSLEVLKLPDACASPALLRAIGQSSSLGQLHICISNKDGSGAEHLLDQPAWHSLAGHIDSGATIEIDFGECEWSAAHVARFWSMGDADMPLPFTSVKMGGSYDGTVPFDSGTLQRIASSCPTLEALDLTGPNACLPAGEPQPLLAEGLLDLSVNCQLEKLSLMNVRLKTTDVQRIMRVLRVHGTLKKLQLSFSLVEPGRMGDIFSNAPDVDEPYTQATLIPHLGELFYPEADPDLPGPGASLEVLYLNDLDCTEMETVFRKTPGDCGGPTLAMPRALAEMVDSLVDGGSGASTLRRFDFDFLNQSGSDAEEDRNEALAAKLVHQLRQAHGHQLRVCVGCFESGGSRNGGYGDQESDSDAGDW